MPDGLASHNRKKLLGCAHTVEMWSRLWTGAEKRDRAKLIHFVQRRRIILPACVYLSRYYPCRNFHSLPLEPFAGRRGLLLVVDDNEDE